MRWRLDGWCFSPGSRRCQLVEAPGGFYVPAVFDAESPSPRAVVGRILGAATAVSALILLVVLLSTGHIEWKLVGLIGILWGAWGFFGGLFGSVLEPAGQFLVNQLTGNVTLPDATETLDKQTARLERLIAQPLEPHHEILVGIRLAEIYRINQHDPAKADALLALLRAKYPDAPELELAGSG
jgi:hypothetical protein